MRQASGTHAADCPSATGWRGSASLPVGPPGLAPPHSAFISHHLHTVFALALLVVLGLLPGAARGQNALQQFAAAMTGPLLPGTPSIPPYDVVVPPGVETVDLQTFQLIGLDSLFGCARLVPRRWFTGLAAIQVGDADYASVTIEPRRTALCSPANANRTHSSVFIAIATAGSLNGEPLAWINIGYSIYRSDDQFIPASGGAFYVEIKSGPVRQLVDLGQIGGNPGYDVPVLYCVQRTGTFDDQWMYCVAEEFEGFLFPIASGTILGPAWQGLTGSVVQVCAEVTAIGNRVPGSLSRPTQFQGPLYHDRQTGTYYFVPTAPANNGILFNQNPFGRYRLDDAAQSTFSVWDIR